MKEMKSERQTLIEDFESSSKVPNIGYLNLNSRISILSPIPERRRQQEME